MYKRNINCTYRGAREREVSTMETGKKYVLSTLQYKIYQLTVVLKLELKYFHSIGLNAFY